MSVGGGCLTDILGPSELAAIGLGLAFVTSTIAAVSGVDEHEAGLASGLINTSQQIGGALGLAVLTTIATSHAHARIAEGASHALAQTDGYQLAFTVGAVLCFLGAIAAAVLLRPVNRGEASAELAEARG